MIPGNTRWTPVKPGQNGDWRQNASIRAIFAACGCIAAADNDGFRNAFGFLLFRNYLFGI